MRASRLLAVSAIVLPLAASAQDSTRAIRRDIPLTNAIRRAFDAGTRDSTGRPGKSYWQTRVDYTISARVDVPSMRVTARETVVIHNNSDSALRTIQLRLDQNLYAANVERSRTVSEITDGMRVTRLTFNGQPVDLNPPPPQRRMPGAAAAPPAVRLAAMGMTTTTARITLPTPIAPRSSATLEADWNFKVPNADNGRGLRMGSWGDSLVQVAQWYPRVAVYDDLRGWDTEPYLGASEFYNNYGRFDVTIDAPAGWLVSATGVLQNPTEVLTPTARERLSHILESDSIRPIVTADERGPGKSTVDGTRLTWRYIADNVSDFAWSSSDRFVFDATRATIPGKGPVPLYLFYVPSHRQQYVQAGSLARHALEFYSKLWMPYEYPQLTLSDGPDTGMEYPMWIGSAAGAADHEAGHQWWPMMVGVNETWYGWMDEGFNQYMNTLSLADRNHRAPNLDGMGQWYGRTSGDEFEGPLMWNANRGGPGYSFQAYGKSPLMLSMLGGIVGDTAVWRAHSDWGKTWRFKHPSPWDYMFFMSNALKRDLGWFWYYWLFTTESVDGSIAGVKTAAGKTTVTVRQDGQMPSPVVLRVKFAPTGAALRPMKNAVMTDSATAVVTWPVDVWFGGSKTFSAVLDFGARPIEKITFDPYCRFPDRDPADNTWPKAAEQAPAVTTGGPGGFGRPRCD
ncbi:MAG: M1 family metallopeptidase [Gemmatimonadaceae bacterium]|nr:M1 family metallopeptidase [Gemmatimonadaceae bacterium]